MSEELTLWEGAPVELADGRIVRWSKDKLAVEELVDGEWVEPSKPTRASDIGEAVLPPRWD